MKKVDAHDEDVVITDTGSKEPGRPTVLAKHSAKEEHLNDVKSDLMSLTTPN